MLKIFSIYNAFAISTQNVITNHYRTLLVSLTIQFFNQPQSKSSYLLVSLFHSCNGLDLNPLEEILLEEVLTHFEPFEEFYGLQVHHWVVLWGVGL